MTHDDDFAPPSEEEIRESERLREALEAGSENEDAELLRAVKSSASPAPLASSDLEARVERALVSFDARKRRGGVVIRVAFGASLLVAAAAVILFFVWREPVRPAPEMARARSTQPLFDGRFDLQGGESARIDRIVVARADDLRENRFARWGVGGRR